MKRFIRASAVAGIVALTAAAASAQTVGIGTTKGGATAQLTAAIAKIVSQKSPMQMRTQPMGGSQQYIPVVNAGELEFGICNMPQYYMAKKGIGLSRRPYNNLILLANMMKFQVGILVAAKSKITKPEDLKGTRFPTGFKASPLIGLILESFLANTGMTVRDVRKVPAVALRQHWNMIKQGKIDVVTAAIGSGVVKDMNAAISGGIRFVSLRDDKAAQARMQKIYPKGWVEAIQPNKRLLGFDKPLNALSYDYMFWTHKGLNNEMAYQAVKAMYENEAALKETSPLWRSHSSRTMAKDQGEAYHPAAIKFYKEVGIWKR